MAEIRQIGISPAAPSSQAGRPLTVRAPPGRAPLATSPWPPDLLQAAPIHSLSSASSKALSSDDKIKSAELLSVVSWFFQTVPEPAEGGTFRTFQGEQIPVELNKAKQREQAVLPIHVRPSSETDTVTFSSTLATLPCSPMARNDTTATAAATRPATRTADSTQTSSTGSERAAIPGPSGEREIPRLQPGLPQHPGYRPMQSDSGERRHGDRNGDSPGNVQIPQGHTKCSFPE